MNLKICQLLLFNDLKNYSHAWLYLAVSDPVTLVDSDPVIIPYMVVNRRFIALFGIITGSLPANYSCVVYSELGTPTRFRGKGYLKCRWCSKSVVLLHLQNWQLRCWLPSVFIHFTGDRLQRQGIYQSRIYLQSFRRFTFLFSRTCQPDTMYLSTSANSSILNESRDILFRNLRKIFYAVRYLLF